MESDLTVLKKGAGNYPFTILVIANRFLLGSDNTLSLDFTRDERNVFDSFCRRLILDLFNALPNSRKSFIQQDDGVQACIKVVSLFPPLHAEPNAADSLVQFGPDGRLLYLQKNFQRFANRYQLETQLSIKPDVVFAVSRGRAPSGYLLAEPAVDGPFADRGVPFQLDGAFLHHPYYCQIPGGVALAMDQLSGPTAGLIALRALCGALGSDKNGFVMDLPTLSAQYANGTKPKALPVNARYKTEGALEIPGFFANYNGKSYASRNARDGQIVVSDLYTSELLPGGSINLLDDFLIAFDRADNGVVVTDKLTNDFLFDRLLTKIARPSAKACLLDEETT
jgi:hypothetical protein